MILARYCSNVRFFGLLLLLGLTAAGPIQAGDQPAEQVIALVDDAPIYAADLEWQWRRQLRRHSAGGLVIGAPEVNKGQLLEELIDQELLYRQALNSGFKPDPKLVNAQIDQLRNRFRSDTDFARELQFLGLGEERLRNLVAKGMVIREFLAVRFVGTQSVSDQEAQAWYREHEKTLRLPGRVCAGHILLRLAPDTDHDKRRRARQRAEELRRRALAGEAFADLARENSDCPSREQGGDLGCFAFSDMLRSFAEAAFALPAGAISEPVETPDGIHLIQVRERHEGQLPPYPQVRDQVLAAVRSAKAQPLIKEFIAARRKAVKIATFP